MNRHLIETDHVIEPNQAFKFLLYNQNSRKVEIGEVLSVRMKRPRLCAERFVSCALAFELSSVLCMFDIIQLEGINEC